MIEIAKPKFKLGQLVATPGALAALTEAGQSPMEFVSRHLQSDWGDCCEQDRLANEDALRGGERLFSVYRTAKGVKIWVITEADRRACCCRKNIEQVKDAFINCPAIVAGVALLYLVNALLPVLIAAACIILMHWMIVKFLVVGFSP